MLLVSYTVVGHLVTLLNFTDRIIDPWKLELTYFGAYKMQPHLETCSLLDPRVSPLRGFKHPDGKRRNLV